MDAEHLKHLFLLLLQSQKNNMRFYKKISDWLYRQDEKRVCVILPLSDMNIYKKAISTLQANHLPPYQLMSIAIDLPDMSYAGFLYIDENATEQKRFLDLIEQSLRS
jgi:hypothetical protein